MLFRLDEIPMLLLSCLYIIFSSFYAHVSVTKNLEADRNKKAEVFASKLKIEDQIEKLNIKNCFITLKNHKSDFCSNLACTLIPPKQKLFC